MASLLLENSVNELWMFHCLVLSTVHWLKLVSKACIPHSRADTNKLGVYISLLIVLMKNNIDVLYIV